MLEEKDLIPQAPSDLTGVPVLALAAHPDDEVLGCGGTLALHVRKGDPVRVLVVTGGEKGDFRGRYGEGYVALREEEDRRALAVLGIREVEFWRYSDRELHQAGDLVGRLREALERHRPGLVYCPSPSEIHPDHRALAHALWEAAGAVEFAGKVAFFEVSAPLRPNTLVDITPVIEQKKAAIQCYRSQLEENDYLEKTLGLNRFRSYTLPSAVRYAEAFWAVAPSSVHPAPLDRVLAEQSRIPSETKDQPLVSIIVRTKDRPKLLERALTSIATQEYRPIEVVLINDGGEKINSLGIKTLLRDVYLTEISYENNRGRAQAANAGLDAAEGEYICFLDDDDLLYPNHIGTLATFLEKSGEKVAYTLCWVVEERPNPGKEYGYEEVSRQVLYNRDFDRIWLLFQNYIPLHTAMLRRDVIGDFRFDESLDLFEDWDFFIRLARKTQFVKIDTITGEYRLRKDSVTVIQNASSSSHLQAKAQVYNKHKDLIQADAMDLFTAMYSQLVHYMTAKESLDRELQKAYESIKHKEIATDSTMPRQIPRNDAVTPAASIIILTYNGEGYIPALMSALLSQETDIKYELVVIDSSSSDGTVGTLRSYGIEPYIICKDNFSHPRTRNQAVAHAKGDYVVFITQDAVPLDQHWLRELLQPFEQYPNVAAVYSRQIPRDDCHPIDARDIYVGAPPVSEIRHVDLANAWQKNDYLSNVYRFMRLSNVSAAYCKDLLLRYPFNEQLVMMEDQEWAKRMLENGYGIVYSAKSVVQHSHSFGMIDVYRRHFDYGRSLKMFMGPNTPRRIDYLKSTFSECLQDAIYILSEKRKLLSKCKWIIMSPLLRTAANYGLYRGWTHG